VSDPILDDPTGIDPGAPQGDPSAGPATPPATPPAAPADGGVAAALANVTNTLATITERLAALETRPQSQAAQAAQAQAAAPAQPPAFDFNDPVASIQQHAGAAGEAAATRVVQQLAPFLESVASSLTQNGVESARSQLDSEFGTGTFDRLVSADLNAALTQLPPAQRANPQTVDALASGIFGGKIRSAEGRKELRDIMAARPRPAPPVVLSGSSAVRPQPGRLTAEEKQIVADIQRSGIPFSEKDYLESRDKPRTEEARGATWMSGRAPAAAAN
jgi:hypothetical protein